MNPMKKELKKTKSKKCKQRSANDLRRKGRMEREEAEEKAIILYY